jgi:ribonuclease R
MEEYYIRIDEAGKVAEVHPRERLDSHKLIEECMIAANVAAAISLQDAVSHAMYRAHEPPTVEKINEIRYFLDRMGYSLSKGDGVQGHHFNRILKEVAEKPERQIVNMAVLRSQTQAYYYPTNRGHFGLALDHYCHFTSPIRRYSDLIVHRLLISSLNLGEDSREYHTPERLAEVADHISQTERRAMLAERDARERYIAAFMADKVGVYFEGTVSSANSFGLFVTVTGTGASGLVPVRSLGDDFYHYDKERNELIGRRYGQIFRAGQRVSVELLEANPATGSLLFGLLSAEEIRTPGGRSQLTGNRYERRATESRVRKDSRGRPEREERSPRHRGKASASRKGKSGSPSGGGGKGKPKRKGR